MTKKISAQAYAKHRGVSGEAVKKAIQQGRITATADKKGLYHIDPLKADKEWDDNTRPNKAKKKTAQEVEPEPTSPDELKIDPNKKLTFSEARTLKENYSARLAKIKFEEESGRLIPAEQAKSDAFKLSRTVRNQILALPDRISAELASMTDAHAINLKLKKEFTECLEVLHSELK